MKEGLLVRLEAAPGGSDFVRIALHKHESIPRMAAGSRGSRHTRGYKANLEGEASLETS